jgi:hypothetical protein
MPYLLSAARLEMVILLGGLMIVVVSKVFAGGIGLSGLLTVSKRPGQSPNEPAEFSPARAQMLMATLLAAMYYLLHVINNPSADSLPDAPSTLVGVLGGSHAIYLAGKVQSAWDLLTARRKKNSRK